MKIFLQILALCLLVAMLCTFAVACGGGDETEQSTSSETTPEYKAPTYGLTQDTTDMSDPADS